MESFSFCLPSVFSPSPVVCPSFLLFSTPSSFCSCHFFCFLFLFFHSGLFSFSFVFVIFPLPTPSLPSFCSPPLCFWAFGQYQRCFLVLFLSVPRLPPSLSPVSSHFHAARWAAMLCFFIAVCGRGGGLLPATNGLLENTDSHASQSGELGREGGRIWNEA